VIRHVRTRVLLSLAVLAGTIAAAGMTTHASFTDSSNAAHAVTSGNVDVELGAAGPQARRLEIGVGGIAPGASADRTFDIANVGSLALSTVTLTTSATSSSNLDTDATDGLHLTIYRCSAAWTETGTAPNYAYTCSGTGTTALSDRPLIGTAMPLTGLSLPPGGAADHLLAHISLPSTAGNAFQGSASTLGFTFTATQRSGSHR
jgi:predicted ribosomally synthesized peptide with SipW-like signal peptide